MLYCKQTCKQLKAIRQQIADANGIDYTPAQCTNDGPCLGTCPHCEAERSYLEQQLSLKVKAGQAIKIIGVAASLMTSSIAQPLAAQEIVDTTVADTSLTWDARIHSLSGLAYLPEDIDLLEDMAKFIEEYPDKLYLMVSHTDARGDLSYNLKLSQKIAESRISVVMSLCAIKDVNIIPVGLASFEPLIPNAKNEVEYDENRRVTLETYNPDKYKGQSAALVEFAIYKKMHPHRKRQIKMWETEIQKLLASPDDHTAEYESLAKLIRSKR